MKNERLHHEAGGVGISPDVRHAPDGTSAAGTIKNFSLASMEQLRRLLPEHAIIPAIMPCDTPSDMREVIRFLWEADGAY